MKDAVDGLAPLSKIAMMEAQELDKVPKGCLLSHWTMRMINFDQGSTGHPRRKPTGVVELAHAGAAGTLPRWGKHQSGRRGLESEDGCIAELVGMVAGLRQVYSAGIDEDA